MAASKKAAEKEKEPETRTIRWNPPYTDDQIDFGAAVGKPGDPDLVMYKPGSATAPTRKLRESGRVVMTLPAMIAENYLTHPLMRFSEVEPDAPTEAEKPIIIGTNLTARPVEPGRAVPNAESESPDAPTGQHTGTDTPTV